MSGTDFDEALRIQFRTTAQKMAKGEEVPQTEYRQMLGMSSIMVADLVEKAASKEDVANAINQHKRTCLMDNMDGMDNSKLTLRQVLYRVIVNKHNIKYVFAAAVIYMFLSFFASDICAAIRSSSKAATAVTTAAKVEGLAEKVMKHD